MNKDRYIAALEIGSSKITAIVGKTTDRGELDIIAVEQETGTEMVRYGIIQNLEETSIRISRIIERLEHRSSIAPRKISALFIGLAGRSLGSVPTEVGIRLPEETEVNDEILRRLGNDVWRTQVPTPLEIVDAVPRTYRIGKQETRSPIGVLATAISATYDLITCRPEIKRNIERTLRDKLHLDIGGYVVTALATGHLILSNDEKRLGCMLVDLGAETTTVTIYKNGNLAYFATIPLGSRNITRDLTSLGGILEEGAEEVKCTSANAIPSEKVSTLTVSGLKISDVSNIVVARSEEIIANIIEQISYAGLKEQDLPGGIIAIGGGFKMNGMIDLLSRQANLPVRKGRLPNYVTLHDIHYPAEDLLQAISILYAGTTHTDIVCLEEPEERELPQLGEANPEEMPEEETTDTGKSPRKSRGGGFFSKFAAKVGNIFATNDEDEDDDELL